MIKKSYVEKDTNQSVKTSTAGILLTNPFRFNNLVLPTNNAVKPKYKQSSVNFYDENIVNNIVKTNNSDELMTLKFERGPRKKKHCRPSNPSKEVPYRKRYILSTSYYIIAR